jgi:hypothetical protein
LEEARRELLVALLDERGDVDDRSAAHRRRRLMSWCTRLGSIHVGMPSRTRPLTSHIALRVPADEPYAASKVCR